MAEDPRRRRPPQRTPDPSDHRFAPDPPFAALGGFSFWRVCSQIVLTTSPRRPRLLPIFTKVSISTRLRSANRFPLGALRFSVVGVRTSAAEPACPLRSSSSTNRSQTCSGCGDRVWFEGAMCWGFRVGSVMSRHGRQTSRLETVSIGIPFRGHPTAAGSARDFSTAPAIVGTFRLHLSWSVVEAPGFGPL